MESERSSVMESVATSTSTSCTLLGIFGIHNASYPSILTFSELNLSLHDSLEEDESGYTQSLPKKSWSQRAEAKRTETLVLVYMKRNRILIILKWSLCDTNAMSRIGHYRQQTQGYFVWNCAILHASVDIFATWI
eukprot:251389_1